LGRAQVSLPVMFSLKHNNLMASTLKKNEKISVLHWFVYILLSCLTFSLLLMVFKSNPNILSTAKFFLLDGRPLNADSWKPMISALNYIKQNSGGDLYNALFLKGVKFQYPLTSLLLFDLTERLTGWSYARITTILNLISRFAVFGTGLISAKILSVILQQNKHLKNRTYVPYGSLFLYLLVLLLTLMFYPLLRSYILGQIQTILTFLVALSILCWQYKKKAVVGAIIGFICLIKPQLGLLLVWAIIRRQWSMVISAAIVITIFLLISLALYGFDYNVEYLQILSFLSHHGESYYANQSVNGMMNRLMFNGENIVWNGKFPAYSPIVYAATVISSLIFILFGLFWNYKSRNPHLVDFCIVILSMTMASPIAWEHHYGIILPIFVVLSPFACYYFSDKRWALLILALGFLLTSQYIENTKYLASTSFNVLQSYLFFGACIILFFLFNVSRKLKLSKQI
jgi:alpha-1,2-mannosyltransferase